MSLKITLMKSIVRMPALGLAAVLLAGCASGAVNTPSEDAECRPSPIQQSEIGFLEIQGDMHSDGELWALLFFGEAHVQEELKIVWRLTGGEGPVTVQAALDDGTTAAPIWGPEFHESSTWERPGDEWGTGFNFPQPGCWTLTVTRGDAAGEIRLDVLPPR
jgi:hypothetical protein